MESTKNLSDAIQRLYDGDTFKANNPDASRLVIKNGKHFLVLSDNGFMPEASYIQPFGLYREDTRYLSTWNMFVNGSPLRLLSSNLSRGFEAEFVYGNQTVGALQEQSLMVRRQLVIADQVHERITLKNYNPRHVDAELAIAFGADFADIFEVRGAARARKGKLKTPASSKLLSPGGRRIKLGYTGLDGLDMLTTIDVRTGAKLHFSANGFLLVPLSLNTGQSIEIDISFNTDLGKSKRITRKTFDQASKSANAQFESWIRSGTRITTGNEAFNQLVAKTYQDLYILRQPVKDHMAIAAGLPWFACAFGRDQAISGMQVLPFFPELAKSVVLNLASYQGNGTDAWREEKPGKIMHELRLGEMVRNMESPFSPYYGTVDATPLWLMLLSRYVLWSGDLALARKLWPQVIKAIDFLQAETKQDGYLRYGSEDQTTALTNQGWKDSFDSVSYSDGSLARGSIALVEAQGYLYAALSGIAELALLIKKSELAKVLQARAEKLKESFVKDFWMEDKDFPAIALDVNNRHCDIVSSNPGHLLGTGILTDRQEKRIVERLMQSDMLTPWGIRTLSEFEASFNPMSYHNGSVWPHDNAVIVDGMGKKGYSQPAHAILLALLNLAKFRDDGRLPELVCGFASSLEEGPISYPISCSPQAWSAGAPLQILASLLGITYDTTRNRVTVSNPTMPSWLGKVTISNLRFGKHFLNLEFEVMKNGRTVCTVLSKSKALTVHLK